MVWAFWNIGLRLWKASLESYLPFNQNLGLFSEHLVAYNFSTWQTPKFCLSNLIIQVLLRTIKIKTAQFCISICYYPRPPAYNQHTFKRNTKTLNFLFSFTALTSTPKPGLLVSAWDKSPVTLASNVATLASKINKNIFLPQVYNLLSLQHSPHPQISGFSFSFTLAHSASILFQLSYPSLSQPMSAHPQITSFIPSDPLVFFLHSSSICTVALFLPSATPCMIHHQT